MHQGNQVAVFQTPCEVVVTKSHFRRAEPVPKRSCRLSVFQWNSTWVHVIIRPICGLAPASVPVSPVIACWYCMLDHGLRIGYEIIQYRLPVLPETEGRSKYEYWLRNNLNGKSKNRIDKIE